MWDHNKTCSAVKGILMAALGAGLAVLAAYQWETDFGPIYGPVIGAFLGAAVNALRLAAMPTTPPAPVVPVLPDESTNSSEKKV